MRASRRHRASVLTLAEVHDICSLTEAWTELLMVLVRGLGPFVQMPYHTTLPVLIR